MISVSNLEKSFGDRTLFTGASFQLNRPLGPYGRGSACPAEAETAT